MKKVWNKIGNIFQGVFNVLAAIVGISLVIAWCVSFVYLSYGLAIWAVQWFTGLI